MSCRYGVLEFPTRLHAHWAAFFDLAGWKWRSNPLAIRDWQPDFVVEFPCGHSECGDTHTLFLSVIPSESLQGLEGHPALAHRYGVQDEKGVRVGDAGALFGTSPEVSIWEMSHGAGGGVDDVPSWVDGAKDLWRQASDKVG